MSGDLLLGTAGDATGGDRVLSGTGDGVQTSPGAAPVQVLICDDHEVLRHGLRTVLLRAPDLTVVGEAAGAAEALALATSTRPDVQELVRALTAMGIRVVLLGEPGAGSDLSDALQAGASGYVHTTVTPQRLIDGVRAVAQGETVLAAAATGELLHRLDDAPRTEEGSRSSSGALTARQ